MVGYAVGEMVESVKTTDGVRKEEKEEEEREGVKEEEGGGEREEEEQSKQWLSQHSCYEVVTTWVHPRYSNVTS